MDPHEEKPIVMNQNVSHHSNGTVHPDKHPVHRGKQFTSATAALLIVMSISAGFLGGWFGSKSERQGNNTSVITPTQRQIADNESLLISNIAKIVGPSVVSVNVTSQGVQQSGLFGFSAPTQQMSAGTGIIINKDGYIITNRHVVPMGSTTVSVTLSDGTKLTDVQVVGRTNESDPLDVAFLKITNKKGKTLVPAKIGDSSKMQVGDRVVAIGNALGQFQNTVTSGIISGFGRSVQAGGQNGDSSENLQDLFQTDAAINEGNSGGPLLNSSGEVIGINTAIAGNAQNIGFSIPINDVQGLIKSILEKGKLLRPYLGIRYVSLTADYAYQFNLNTQRGAYIAPDQMGQSSIISGSPADKAGLKEKDVITKINGTTIDENNSLTSLIGRFSVGDEVTLTIVRDGKEQSIKVQLEAQPTS
ncbi:MAG: trypsin-like peptidase domain-containing protein [Candidatus Saccharimonadales bacterium]